MKGVLCCGVVKGGGTSVEDVCYETEVLVRVTFACDYSVHVMGDLI